MKRLFIIAILVSLAALLGGCAAKPSIKAAGVLVAEAEKVKKCRFLGQVSGSAAHEGFGLVEGETKAKNDALDVAATLGATHLVWVETSGGLNPTALGKAYRCQIGFSKMIFPPRRAIFSGTGRPPPKEVKAWLSGVQTGLDGGGRAKVKKTQPQD